MSKEDFKLRYYITPSNLASYFGCGFNSPEEQFAIDTGEVPVVFDDDSIERMELGNYLEDPAIEFFQNQIFKTPITDRNTELKTGYDGKIKYKIDGMMDFKGERVIFENKISNAKSYKFTENLGYIIQIHAYMLCEGVNGAILAGLYQGRPIWKYIPRDEELIEDLKTMVDFLYNSLSGVVDFYEDFPVDLLEKYGKTKIYEPIENLSRITVEYLHELAKLNDDKKDLDKKIRDFKKAHENDFDISEGFYEDDVVSLRVSKWQKKGGFNVDKFANDNPHIDLLGYYDDDTEMSRTVLKLK